MSRSRTGRTSRASARALAATAAVACLALLAACTSSSSPSASSSGSGGGGVVHITLSHGYTDVEAKAITAQVKEWNASHPKIQVTLVYNTGNDFALQKTVAGFAAGAYPDIAYEYGSSIADLAGRQQVVDLTDKVKSSSFDWEDFFSFERDAATANGKVYGVPALVDNLALVYNKKMFAAAGLQPPSPTWTWDDFRNAAKKLTDPGKKQFGWAYVNDGSEDTVWRWEAMLWQAGGDILNSDGTKTAFDSPAGLDATTLLKDMSVDDHSVYLDPGNQNYLNLFNANKVGMLWTGPWDLSSINSDVDYGVQVLPSNNAHSSIAGPDNWMLFDNGKARQDAAWTFLTWLVSAPVHLKFAIDTGDLPTRESETKQAGYQEFLSKYPGDAVFVQNLANVTKARPNIKAYPQISQALGSQLQGVLLGKIEPQAALTAAAQQSDSVLAGGG